MDGDQSVSTKDKILREVGYADELGSGMRNTNKYTKLYSGGTPVFIEDNVFVIQIPIANVAGLQVGAEETEKVLIKSADKKSADKKSADKKVLIKSADKKVTEKTQGQYNKILSFMEDGKEYRLYDFCELLGVKESRVRKLLRELSDYIDIVGGNRDRRYKKK